VQKPPQRGARGRLKGWTIGRSRRLTCRT
jgi:hypothetical protein